MLLERRDIRGGSYAEAPNLGPQSSLGEVAATAFDEALYARNVNAAGNALEEAYDRRLDAIFAATGQRGRNPLRLTAGDQLAIEAGAKVDHQADFQRWLVDLADQQPQFRDVIKPDRPVLEDAIDLQRRAIGDAADVYARGGRGAWLASMAGSFAGAGLDPLNLAALAAGPFGEVGVGARAVLWNAAKVGAINAGTEVAAYPFVKAWREQAGLDYSLGELAQNAGTAFLFGGAIDAGGRAIFRGVSKLRGEPKPAPPVGDAADRALDISAATLPPENVVRRAAEGDLAALDQVVAATGQADDPAVRGARTAAALEDGLTSDAPLVDTGDGLSRLAQAIRSLTDDTEPPPGRADPVLPERGPPLADEAPLPRAEVGSNQHTRRFTIEGKPVTFRDVDPRQVFADPATFQFKGGGDAAGATARLSGVETWDPVAAGRAMVFENKDGAQIIADGHQRLSLAKRLMAGDDKANIGLPAFVFREADGWTPADVRALAAKKNLQEGSGTTIDAAKIIRERPDIIDASVPLASDAMRQARSLARLSDEAFGKVVAGVVPPNHAAMIGDLVPDRTLHSSMVDELVAADPANAREARFIVSELMHAPVQHEVQLTLLGAETISRPLLRERAKVLDAALKLLREDKQIFGMLEREAGRIERTGNILARGANAQKSLEAEAVAAAIEDLAASRGPVSDWLTEAAREIAGDRPVRKAAEAFALRVRETLKRDGLSGLLSPAPEPLRANGFDDVTGPEAKAQVESLGDLFGDAAKAEPKGIRVFHGSPHAFESFDGSKIGSGEGAQAYGYGHYFAESEGVALSYREKLSTSDSIAKAPVKSLVAEDILNRVGGDREKAMKMLDSEFGAGADMRNPVYADAKRVIEAANPGRLYEVRINAEPEQFLDWDKPLGEQSEIVRKLARGRQQQLTAELRGRTDGDSSDFLAELTGADLMQVLQRKQEGVRVRDDDVFHRDAAPDHAAVANELREAGLVGIRYLDASSREAGSGTSNFVVFPGNEHLVRIEAVDGVPRLADELEAVKRENAIGVIVEGCQL